MQIIAQPTGRHLLLSFVKDHPMNIRKLGAAGPATSALGLGCMGMSDFYGHRDDVESTATIHHAVERGVTFFDTADMYGPHTN